MKVVFDTNVYISWIREKRYPDILLDVQTQKHLSCHVLMELWAGARTKEAVRIVEKLQKPYRDAGRIVVPAKEHYIRIGRLLSALPDNLSNKRKQAGFVNDIAIAVEALSIGALLFTENRADFEIIGALLPELNVRIVS